MIKKVNLKFWVLYKIFNIINNKFQLLYNIIKYNNVEKFKYNNYLTIFILKLLLYIIIIDARLVKDDRTFILK